MASKRHSDEENREGTRGDAPRYPPVRRGGDYGGRDRSPPPRRHIDEPSTGHQLQRGESQTQHRSRYSARDVAYSSSGHSRARAPEHGGSYPTDPNDRPHKSHKRDSGEIVRSEEAPRRKLPPLSGESVGLPLRPGKGTKGAKRFVKANHFIAELSDKDLHRYDVSISPEVASRAVNRDVVKQLVNLYRESHLGKRLPAYDGRKGFYTAGPLPFEARKFTIELTDKEDNGPVGPRKTRSFEVVIKFAGRIALSHSGMFVNGKVTDAPQELLQVLDVVLREQPTDRYFPVGRSFYFPHLGGRDTTNSLGEGLEGLRGFHQSIRPTQRGLSLNIDMSSTAFIEPVPVVDFVHQLLGKDVRSRNLSDSDCVKIKRALRGVRVEVTHRGRVRRKYTVSGLTSQTTGEITFSDEQGTNKTLVDYFEQTYRYVIKHTHLPCLQVGKKGRKTYLPMEVCTIVKGQRWSGRLNDMQINKLLQTTCVRPRDREQDILKTVQGNAYGEDLHAEEFGVKISERMAVVEARMLAAPQLKYHDSGREREFRPQKGSWNMKNKRVVQGGRVSHWFCVNFAPKRRESAADHFCQEVARACNTSGMAFSTRPVLQIQTGPPDEVESVLKSAYMDCMAKLRPIREELDMIFVILPDKNGNLYGNVKRICETDVGVVTQCCLEKNISRHDMQFFANVALKINVKVGGVNTALVDAITRRIPVVGEVPTMIFGADVTHPQPGENLSPSIAAVVASVDWPNISKYMGLVSAQAHREELIQDLYKTWEDPVKGTMHGGMIRELLLEFYRINGRKPHRLIFYRDGVSDGEFYQVLLFELDAIRKACASLQPEGDYQPYVTFIVVQKRHHTRLFANDYRDHNSVDRSGNILPGTVVDSDICHPSEFDFFLCSHPGLKGTSRPAHYHVLWDENEFSADNLQALTYELCYTYARCTRSVSIVPPAYYAHLAAFRARFYMDPEASDGGSVVSSRGRSRQDTGSNVAVRPLPRVRSNVKRVMFYC